MKLERIEHTLSTTDDTELSLAVLSQRIGDELCDLVDICSNVENALGIMVDKPAPAIDHPIVAIQGLDKLQQTLEDLARLSKMMAETPVFSNHKISKRDVLKPLVLTGLADRLTRSKTTMVQDEQQFEDEIWE